MVANIARTACACEAGWTLGAAQTNSQRGECQECAAGKFKNKTGDESCSQCENVKSHNGVVTCVDVVNFRLFLVELLETQYVDLQNSIAILFEVEASMVEIQVESSGRRRLLSAPFAIHVSVSVPNQDASGASTPAIPTMQNIYQGLAEDNFAAAIMLIDGSTDTVHLTEGFAPDMQLRTVLNTNIGGNWSAGDKVFVCANGQRGMNNVVLTYVGVNNNTGENSWSPVNCQPLLLSNSSYLFFLKGAHVNLLLST